MLTRRGRLALAAFISFWIVGRILGVTELIGIGFAIGTLLIVCVLRIRLSRVRATVTARLSPEVIEAGQPTVLELLVENAGLGPTPPNRVQLVPTRGGRHRILVPRLAPGERATVTIGLDSSRRGRRAIAGYDVQLTDGLGLAVDRLTTTGSIGYLVRPRTEELPHTLPLSAGGGRESLRSSPERLRTGLSMLRMYIEGDDLRRIHWRTTARVGELMVREGGDPDAANKSGATIILGTGRAESEDFERAVEIAASLAAVAAHEGQVRVLTTNGFDSGFDTGPAHLDAISLHLATVQPTGLAKAPSRRPKSDKPGPAELTSGDAVIAGLSRRSSSDEWNVLVTVEACEDPNLAELSPDVLSALPGKSGAIVSVLVGGDNARFERLSRHETVIYLPAERAMHDIWNMAFDLPVGETRSIDATPAEIEQRDEAKHERRVFGAKAV